MAFTTPTSLLLRTETFWVALALIATGSLVTTSTIWIGIIAVDIGEGIGWLGSLLILAQVVISTLIILRTAYEGWRYGYAEGLLGVDR